MIRLVKIESDLFPERYKQYTNFPASYGFVGIVQNRSTSKGFAKIWGTRNVKHEEDSNIYSNNPTHNVTVHDSANDTSDIILFLDPRYYTAAEAAAVKFLPLNKMPRENCIIDPFELSIAEFERYKFVEPKFAYYENYKLTSSVSIEHLDVISQFLNEHPQKQYLITNFNNIAKPTVPFVLNEDGVCADIDESASEHILFDPDITPLACQDYLTSENAILDPVRAQDAVIENIGEYAEFLRKDCIAWMNFWYRLEREFKTMNELDAAHLLEAERAAVHGNPKAKFSLAFETIVGNNQNAAKIHGRASQKPLESGVLLVDAGSRITAGESTYNSDITRVFFLGTNISHDVKVAYTKTLQAHIAVATYVFPKTTSIQQLDQLAREYVQFDHALGHGVGKTDIHAYPSIRGGATDCLKLNTVLAIEPGFYVPGKFGIRLESIMRVVEFDASHFCFEYLTFLPFEYDLVQYDLLNEQQRVWLSNFHEICYNRLQDDVDIGFLKRKTSVFV